VRLCCTAKQELLQTGALLLGLPTSFRILASSILLLSFIALVLTSRSMIRDLLRPSNQKAWAEAKRLRGEAQEAAKSGQKSTADELFRKSMEWGEAISDVPGRALAFSTIAGIRTESDRNAGLQMFDRAIKEADGIGPSDQSQYLGQIALDLALAGEHQRARELLIARVGNQVDRKNHLRRIATAQAKADNVSASLETLSSMYPDRFAKGSARLSLFQIGSAVVEIAAVVAAIGLFWRRGWAIVTLRTIGCVVAVLLGLYLLINWLAPYQVVLQPSVFTVLLMVEGWVLFTLFSWVQIG
jgi:hypothetical protein